MKQHVFFKNEKEQNSKYTKSVGSPLYEPKNKKPHILELCNKTKTDALISKIEKSSVSELEKKFLLEAAKRHSVFHYEKIADYYAHSNKEMQELMEDSALVIIDFESAIEKGFVKLSKEMKEQYLEHYNGKE
jgi:hypothetical protein